MNEDGILLLNKPGGITSTRALSAAKKHLHIKKAGHGGTLDPLATGLLILLFGEATRYAQYILNHDKRYIADIHFGYTSDSDDADGNLTQTAPPPPQLAERLQALLPTFCGNITQTAPIYSALKHNGRPLYDYARRNIPVAAKVRQVTIHSITLQQASANRATIAVSCGSGVYIRALARDIGAALGCGAYLTALQRTDSGKFNLHNATTIEQLSGQTTAQCRCRLLPIHSALYNFPAAALPLAALHRLGNGMPVATIAAPAASPVQIFSPAGRFAGLANYHDGCYHALKFLHWTRHITKQ